MVLLLFGESRRDETGSTSRVKPAKMFIDLSFAMMSEVNRVESSLDEGMLGKIWSELVEEESEGPGNGIDRKGC